ncbi:MAG: phosphate ABC transporter permease family protein, partial [Gammaproteobacteria bacterium]
MSPSLLLITLLLLSSLGYRLGKKRSLASVGGKISELHSLPGFYGFYTALWSLIPAVALTIVWLSLESPWLAGTVLEGLPADKKALPETRLTLVLNDILNVVNG